MVGGFNTNIRYNGRTFHVQTEDSGETNPQVHTLLYEGGAILYSCKRSYEKELQTGNTESAVRALMEEQHRGVVQDLKSGALDHLIAGGGQAAVTRSESAVRFGEGIITEHPLAELILSQLSSE